MPVPSQPRRLARSAGTSSGSSIRVKNGCMLNRIAARPAPVIVRPTNSAICESRKKTVWPAM
jgi:hypothetical protein